MIEAGWITKRDAATLAEVDERTIERKARAGKIASKRRPGFPTWYWQADVEMLRQTGSQEVRTGLLTAGPNGNGNGHSAIASPRSPAPLTEAWFMDVLQALRGALTQGPIGPTGPTAAPTGPTAETYYVTVQEAAAILGLPQTDVRALVHDGDLFHRVTSRGGIRIRRKDLEAF